MNILECIHSGYIQQRRISVLADHLHKLIPADASVLDVGCGDGQLSHLINKERADLSLSGIDVLVREKIWIPVQPFDGKTIPAADHSYDVVMFIDVLHHADDSYALLREASRVARKSIIIKDHLVQGVFAKPTLRLMDCIGNARYGVALPGNYWRRSQWEEAFQNLSLTLQNWVEKVDMYPKAIDLFFGRSLHFVAKLGVGTRTC